ncbi:MAG: sulfatase-like hydrolase/transferase, partial [Verrucomicrobiota bacterium]
EIAYDNNWLYLRSSNLAGYVMGPWYTNQARTNLFPNYPANNNTIYRIPRVPIDPTTVTTKTLTTGGVIGFMVNGVSMYDSRDAFSYDSGSGSDVQGNGGDRTWNRDAYINEGISFDAGNAHQAAINHHYHANPSGLRYQLGDSVTYDAPSNTYSESFNGQHSPIIAWVEDGLPVYGPYGYSDPLDATSPVRRMITGYQIRTDIAANGSARSTWPSWATRVYSAVNRSFVAGPNVSNGFPLGRYMEDNDYKGDLAGFSLYTSESTQGVFNESIHFDLNEYNARWCVTPEFPSGTWAYFTCIEENGTPVFPYNIARVYFGDPVGGPINEIPNTATTHFEGGPEAPLEMTEIDLDTSTEDVTLVWSAVEGGSYQVQQSDLSEEWQDLGPEVLSNTIEMSVTDTDRLSTDDSRFYRVRYTGIADFDETGYVFTPPSNVELTTILVTLASGGAAPPTDLNVAPSTITFNGVAATLVSRPSQYVIEIQVDLNGLVTGNYTASADWGGAIGEWTGEYSYSAPQHNILLIILDDWGIDSSPIDNPGGASLPTMATLQSLADTGLRFENAYVQPACSPTRANIITGRISSRHDVYSPGDALPASELTLPEIFAAATSPYALASYGKWHLGNGDTGPATTGGWTEFKGITAGGVGDYYSWNKNENGTQLPNPVTTYATTEIANDTIDFINAQDSTNTPWFAWVAFNAPHTPFHDPVDTSLLQSTWGAGDTDNRSLYEKALEAVDSEIYRILQNVDLENTNVILIGDNGTPGQVVQAPFGNGRSKGSLYEGGTHVPLVITGPNVTTTGTTVEPVHCTDLFNTILDLAGIDTSSIIPGGTVIDSRSIIPTLRGEERDDKIIVVDGQAGRALFLDGYRLVIVDDPTDNTDTASYEFYYIPDDPNEQSNLLVAPVSDEGIAVYNALVDHSNAVGGNYNAGSYLTNTNTLETVYIELPNPGTPNVPNLTNNNGNVDPIEILIGGQTATFVARVNTSEVADRYWVKATFDPVAAGLSAGTYSMTVQFRDRPSNGQQRLYTALNTFTVN